MLKVFLIGFILPIGIASCVVPVSTPYAVTSDAHPLEIGQFVSDQLSSGSERIFSVQTSLGDVIQGNLTAQDITLDVVDKQGTHLRRLAHGDGVAESFMWVASSPQEMLVLRTSAHTLRNYHLVLTRALASVPHVNKSEGGSHQGASNEKINIISPKLIALSRALAQGETTDAFWQALTTEGTPLVEPINDQESIVTFLWRGAIHNVRLFGAPSGNHESLYQLPHSDVWWRSFIVPNTTRLSYRLAPDVPAVQGSAMDNRRVILATAQRDPLNQHIFPENSTSHVDTFQGSSALTLRQAPAQPWVKKRPDVENGTLSRFRFASQLLNNERDVWTYIPAGPKPEALLVLFDAHAYLNRVPTPIIIDNLIADGLIPQTAVVFIDNASPESRGQELPPNKTFAAFLSQELMPWVSQQGLKQPASRTIIAGSSYGGLAASYAGLTNSTWFGGVLSLSGSYWWGKEKSEASWLTQQYAQSPVKNVKFYLDAGRFEVGRGETLGILETSRQFGDMLRRKGYDVVQFEHDSGHDYLHWQGALACGLVSLLNSKKSIGLAACNPD